MFCGLLLHGVFVASSHLVKDVLDTPRPPDLGACYCDHSEVLQDPLDSFLVTVSEDRFFHDPMERLLHLQVHSCHPYLDRAVIRLDDIFEIEGFRLVGLHTEDLFAFGHEEFLAVIEELQHMWLDGFWI